MHSALPPDSEPVPPAGDTEALDSGIGDAAHLTQSHPALQFRQREHDVQTEAPPARTHRAVQVEDLRASAVRLLAADILCVLRASRPAAAAAVRSRCCLSRPHQLAWLGVGLLGLLVPVVATFYDAYQTGAGDQPLHLSVWRTGQHWLSHAFAGHPPL